MAVTWESPGMVAAPLCGGGGTGVSRGSSTSPGIGVGKDRTSGGEEIGVTREMRDDDSQPAVRVLVGDETVHTFTPGQELNTSSVSAEANPTGVRADGLWEQVFLEANMVRAVRQVVANRGAAGVDGMTIDELSGWFETSWPGVKDSLQAGSFQCQPLCRVEIPKPGGGRRMLGIPTVVDRVIQTAITQVLVPIFDPGFSDSSFGYRPGRSAHQAVETARGYVAGGSLWVVALDLDRFFDRVNHDMVMARVARRVADKRLLKLIRAFVEAGVMVDGVKQPVTQGTPQGSPLSPLLSNLMLDDLDRELEERGHRFVRYADDVWIYVSSQRAAVRVLDSVSVWVEKRLKLKVNRQKSTVGLATKVMVLGFGFFLRNGIVQVRVAPEAVARMKIRIRRLTSRSWGVSLSQRLSVLNRFTAGWVAYFSLADTPSLFDRTDQWVRRRLRQAQWEAWKNNQTRVRELTRLGAPSGAVYVAVTRPGGQWRASGSVALNRALTNRWWADQGLHTFTDHYQRHRHT